MSKLNCNFIDCYQKSWEWNSWKKPYSTRLISKSNVLTTFPFWLYVDEVINCSKCLHSRLLHGWPIIIKLFRSRPCLRVDDRFFDKMPWKPSITKVQWKSAKIHNSNLYQDFFCEKCSFCLIMMSSSWLLKIDLELINEFDDWRCFDCSTLPQMPEP